MYPPPYLYEAEYCLRAVISCAVLCAHKHIHKGLELLYQFKRGRMPHTLEKEAALLVILHQLVMEEGGKLLHTHTLLKHITTHGIALFGKLGRLARGKDLPCTHCFNTELTSSTPFWRNVKSSLPTAIYTAVFILHRWHSYCTTPGYLLRARFVYPNSTHAR